MPKYENDYARNLILDRITRSESFLRPMRDIWNEIYSLYVCYTKNYQEILSGDRANVFVPYVFSKIETKLPRIIQAMVAGEDWFKVVGTEEQYDENAKFHDKLMKYQFNAELDTILFFMTFYKEAMMYGNSFAGVFYEKEVKQVREKVPRYIDKLGNNLYPHILGYDFQQTEKVSYDGVNLVPFDIFDCYPDPRGLKVNGIKSEAMDYFIIRSEPSANYLKAMTNDKDIAALHGWDVKAVQKFLDSKPTGSGLLDRNRTERLSFRGLTTVGTDDYASPHYEMYTMWEDDSVVSIIDNEIVRNCGPDKFPFYEMRKPVVMALDTPVPHEMWALGQIKPILRLQYYAQDLENAKLDAILDEVYPGYFANIEQLPEGYLNILKKNMRGLHACTGSPATVVAQIQKSDKALIATNEQVNIERLLNMTLGSSDVIAGQPAHKKTSATEIMSQLEQANYRFDLSIRLLKDFSQKDLLMMMIDRNKQYAPEMKNIQSQSGTGGMERTKVSPDKLLGNFDVLVKTSPQMGNKMVYAQNLIKFLEILDSGAGQSQPELVKIIGKTLGIEEAGDYIKDPKREVVQMIVQAAQEGLLNNGQQAAMLLKVVLDKLAPPPSPKIGQGRQPAQNEQQLVKQNAGAGAR